MSVSVLGQVREIFARYPDAVDRNAILRKKEFVLSEDAFARSIVCLNVTENLAALIADPNADDVNIRDHIRLDAHVYAVLRSKVNFEGTEIPYTGKVVQASHADIHEAGAHARRVKIKRIKDDFIHLENHVSFRAGAEIRLMKIERAQDHIEADCRVCKTKQWLPVFHGTPGICRECNNTKVNPAKNKMGSLLLWLLNEAIYFEEIGPKPRVFKADDVKILAYERGRYTVETADKQEVLCYQPPDSGTFKEIVKYDQISMDEFKVEEEVTENSKTKYRSGDKWYIKRMSKWAEGLDKKLATLRTNKNSWHPRAPAAGQFFNNDDTHGDQTLAHMRRMFNIARAKQLVDSLRVNKKNYEECTDHLMEVFNQPDCSRQLYSIAKTKLDQIRQAGLFTVNLHTEWAAKVVGMMTAIDTMMHNTEVLHA